VIFQGGATNYHHFAVVWDHTVGTYGEFRLYLNGDLEGSASPNQPAANGVDPNRRFSVGGMEDTYDYAPAGRFADVGFSNRLEEMRFVAGALSSNGFLNGVKQLDYNFAYFELDGGTTDAINGLNMATIGSPTVSTTDYVTIANPETHTPWLGNDAANVNGASVGFTTTSEYKYDAPPGVELFKFQKNHAFTVEGYVKLPASQSTNAMCGTRSSSAEPGWSGWHLRGYSGYVQFWFVSPPGSGDIPAQALGLGTDWGHFAFVYDPTLGTNGQMVAYVNGVETDREDAPTTWTDDTLYGDFTIGGRGISGNWSFTGQLDEIRYSNEALSPSEFLNPPAP
jgi:hypothetical protein